jgi:amino acid adenylation domain-containing protein/thioester reductase-like protein
MDTVALPQPSSTHASPEVKPSMAPGEARRVEQWERGPVCIRPAQRFHELFESEVDAQPDRRAVVTEAGVTSYAELEQEANRIARILLDHGVVREQPVAVLTECSVHLPATVLGVWKAGAAYLPLGLEQPPERLAFMASDAGAKLLIALDGNFVPPALESAVETILRPDREQDRDRKASPLHILRPKISGAPQDLAYIIYTSGTSGMPKGVLIQHDALVNVAYMSEETFGLTSEDRVALVATPGFDASLWELSIGLLHGRSIAPVSRALRDDPWALKRWYKANGVTVAFHTPSYLRVSQQTPFEGLRVLIAGGEAPSHDDARHYATHVALWNAYGPTETCIYVCAEEISAHPSTDRPLAVGRPLANTRISIRRENGDSTSPEEIGEVWLGGLGLARGYLNNPELTAQKFVATQNGRFYRTGDLGRWTEDGRLELAGRIDDQIKFHGQRVELGEIEQALRSHAAVEDAVTLVETAAEQTKTLRAFIRLRPGAVPPSKEEWRDHLGGLLPMHMVPASVSAVATIPLTFAGKVDRAALLSAPREQQGSVGKTPPRGQLEMRIATVWQELLKSEAAHGISRDDNFFALGGNSLLAVTMAHRLSRELERSVPARELFAAPTLAGFAQRVELLSNAPAAGPICSDLATEGQTEFWVAQVAGLDTRTFTIPLLCVVEDGMPSGFPSLTRWNKAWTTLVARHEALRTSFYEDEEGRLRRAIVPVPQMAELETANQSDLGAARAFVRQRQAEPFDMATSPLWRAGLIEIADSGEWLFWLALHHSVGDGRSLGIIVEELEALLRDEHLRPLVGNFGESAHREEDYLAGSASCADARYWRDLLIGQPDEVFAEAPLDWKRSIATKSGATKSGNHRFEARLDANVTAGLHAIARHYEASLHAVMLTLLALEARRRTGRPDTIIGATASTRENAAEGHVVGYYVNMLPIPCHIPEDFSFGTALRETQKSLAAGLQHARYPFARMYRDFWSERPQDRDPARYPLFDLAVTENPKSNSPASATLGSKPLRLVPVSALAYELTGASPGEDMVLIHESLNDGGMLLQWHVNAAIYSEDTARSWFDGLRGWAEWLTQGNAQERAQRKLPALSPREQALLDVWEQGAKVARPSQYFHELFEHVLDSDANSKENQGGRPAIVTNAGTITYAALEREANITAHYLLSQGVVPGAVVGVVTGRSAKLPATVLGIWKAGATYLPLSADLPQDRLAFMARDAGITHLIALDGLAAPPTLPPAIRPEELGDEFRRKHGYRPQNSVTGSDVAYIIYTSGSSGQPKGTLIDHDAYVNSLLGAGETYGLNRDDRSLMFASPSFDVSLSDIGLPLAFGASLCPVPYDVLSSPNCFRAFVKEFGVTVADVTPTYLRLLEGATLPSLRILVTGGEAPFRADIETYAGRLAYFNAYGPTENTITSTLGRMHPSAHGMLSGGRPLPNTSVYVRDADGNPVAPGVIGELWLGGMGLARGYVGRPELTAAAFVETERGRRYRTGDLGRWSATGEIEILGRIDDQVKINGIRVELGEIEHVLSGHPAIAQAVALLDGDEEGNHSLWAFVRPLQGMESPTEVGWREYLAGRLPVYMIPSAVIAVDEIPLSNSGKVDKAALMSRLAGRPSRSGDSEPQPGLEAEIARLWSDLLGESSIRRDDNFFSLGGHSLLAIAMAHRLEAALGYPVPARELFAEPTLRGFAQRVSQLIDAVPQKEEDVSSDRATEGQREFWIAERAGLDTRGFNIPLLLSHRGKVAPSSRWRSAWAELVARHDALRTCFQEDGKGVLRRSAVSELSGDFEISSQPDMPTTLACIRERQAAPFMMENPPLWRAGLTHVLDREQHVFWLILHHSVADGVSLSVLTDELSALLKGESLPPVAGHFDQSAAREERYLSGSACEEDALYWLTMLAALGDDAAETPQPFEEWPLDSPRPLGHTPANAKGSHSFRVHLDVATVDGLRDLAQRNGASLHALMLTLMALEVRRRTGRPDFLLGTAASTRDSIKEARIIGYYVNLLPLPCRVRRGESVEQALRAMQQNLAEGLQHARYPFARIYADFRQSNVVPLHPARYPLCDLAVTENPGAAITNFCSIAHTTGYELRVNAPAQDMVLVHEGQADGSLILQWYVNASIYEKETAKAWINALAGWAHFLTSSERLPDSPLPDLLAEEEKLLAAWEFGPEVSHPASSFLGQFEHWARRQPGPPALITEQGIQSYAEMDTRTNALAHAFLARGLKRQEVVGVLTGRSIALPEIVLAIWKAGGCYLPLVSDLPDERLAFIARDAGIRMLVVLDDLELPASLAAIGCQVLRSESFENKALYFSSHNEPVATKRVGVRGSDLAYIIYTSGSTGEPKGVMLSHQGLNNLALGIANALEMRSDDRVSMMAAPGFDAWISELVMAWAAGAAVVPILRGEMDDIPGLQAKFLRQGVTVATMPPSYLRLFEQADFPSLRVLVTAGEPPHLADARHYASRLRYLNGYGPTENTVAASYGQVTAQTDRLTVGRPLPNTSIQIRGSEGESIPPSAVGMIWLGGAQLALGYLNRPDLTAPSFVETPSGRRYCTGDIGRWTRTGELEVLGRRDGQVKLRGHRVELGEVECRLAVHPSVRQAVAAVETESNGAQTLWAFVCLHAGTDDLTQADWQAYLSTTLPSYMLPSAVIPVPAIPVNGAGKVDRAALLRVAIERRMLAANFSANNGDDQGAQPREGLEQRIARVWAEHLEATGTESRVIGREDNFFDLGGNSLRAIAVVNHLRRTVECTVNDLYEHPRLADFASVCQERPDHLRSLIESAARHWQGYREGLVAYEAERDATLSIALRDYKKRSRPYRHIVGQERRDYGRVLLTGATGYLGSYLLRELLGDDSTKHHQDNDRHVHVNDRHVDVLVRGSNDQAARARLGEVLRHYFGEQEGAALRDNPRLTVTASDLRRDDLGLSPREHDRLTEGLQAIFHCAANVKHFGHYSEFHADNVAATSRLLKLASRRAATPADFHFVSTLSTCGKAPEGGFRLFTEYDTVPETLDENYYVRSKQQAERLVVAARASLANACIHRVGSLVFAADSGVLQFNISENALFRQIASFLCLGVVPDDSHLWLCHVDVVARGLLLLAGAADLTNETHHLENARRDSLAAFVAAVDGVRVCGFDAFLKRLEAAVDEPSMSVALAETMENLGLYRGVSPQARALRLEVVSGRTQILLARLGLVWPSLPPAGQTEMLRQAGGRFSSASLLHSNAA